MYTTVEKLVFHIFLTNLTLMSSVYFPSMAIHQRQTLIRIYPQYI